MAVIVACVTCDQALQDRLFDEHFVVRLLTIPVPLILGGILVALVVHALVQRLERGRRRPLLAPVAWSGTLFGLGLGGFLDGIVLHQVLQVHQMISNHVPIDTLVGKNVNMFWDGMFHVGAWTLTLLGMVALWRAHGRGDAAHSTGALAGSWLLGWGLFNVMDSALNHYLLRYHDLVERSLDPWAWNHAFLAFALAQTVIGWIIVHRAVRRRGAI